LPDQENAALITLPTAEFEAFDEQNERLKRRRGMREPAEKPDEPEEKVEEQTTLRAPDGEALHKANEDAAKATATNHKIRLIQPTLGEDRFRQIARHIELLRIDPINLIARGDPDAMKNAIRKGCKPEDIKDVIEHVNTLVFNDDAHTRNQWFQKELAETKDDEWHREMAEEHPVPEGEIDPKEYDKASDHRLYRGLATSPEFYSEFKKTYERWGDIKQLGMMMKVAHDAGLSSINMQNCQDCGFHTQATNKLCPFCKRHMREIHNPKAPDEEQAYGSAAIHRLAKSLIVDNEKPGCAYTYRGGHSLLWRQMRRLLKLHHSWQEERTWCYNSRDPGQPFKSLIDRIDNDDVFRLNLILNGGWTKDTFHILV
jgi:hypothetical protein